MSLIDSLVLNGYVDHIGIENGYKKYSLENNLCKMRAPCLGDLVFHGAIFSFVINILSVLSLIHAT